MKIGNSVLILLPAALVRNIVVESNVYKHIQNSNSTKSITLTRASSDNPCTLIRHAQGFAVGHVRPYRCGHACSRRACACVNISKPILNAQFSSERCSSNFFFIVGLSLVNFLMERSCVLSLAKRNCRPDVVKLALIFSNFLMVASMSLIAVS